MLLFVQMKRQVPYCAVWFLLGMIFTNLLQDSGSDFEPRLEKGRTRQQPHGNHLSDEKNPDSLRLPNRRRTAENIAEGAISRVQAVQHAHLDNNKHIPEERTESLNRRTSDIKAGTEEGRIPGGKDVSLSASRDDDGDLTRPGIEMGRIPGGKDVSSLANRDDYDDLTRPNRCTKTLHIYSPLVTFIPELHHFVELFQASNKTDHESDIDCVSFGFECDLRLSIGADANSIKGKDAVLFGFVAVAYRRNRRLQKIMELGPEPGQTWIYYSTETPLRVVKWMGTLEITRLKYHVLMTYSSQSDIHIPFGYYKPFTGKNDGPKDNRFLTDDFYRNRTGQIAWVASNCDDVFWPRKPFTAELRKHLPLDTYGRCGTKECQPKRSSKCNQLFEGYKFYLAIPNSECHDYITEKFWLTSLKHGPVPVVVGTQRRDYIKWAPPNSFIHFGDFKTLEDVFEHLRRVDQDETQYRKYHEWRNYGEVVTTFPLKLETMCRTVPHIYKRKPDEFKLVGDSPWYNGCRESPERALNWTYNTLEELENWTIWR